jgi:hypothetical protein
MRNENLALREQIDQALMFEEIVGSSLVLQTVLSSNVKVAPTDSTVLITGETGTGKKLIARAIYKRSQRSGQAFISVNCASIPSSLIASALFGHEKGAFTGAAQRRQGRFELAHSGTNFSKRPGLPTRSPPGKNCQVLCQTLSRIRRKNLSKPHWRNARGKSPAQKVRRRNSEFPDQRWTRKSSS